MKTHKKLQNILTMTAILLSCFAFCQEQKEYINYQGVARDASNEIMASQTMVIGISLRFGSPTATVIYAETHNTVTTDISGVFSLQIGNGAVVSGIYKDLEWGKLAPYATITLNGTDVGTVALQSVPYANASGKATKMELDDLTNVEGTPTSGQVLKFDGTDWTPATDETGAGSNALWTENGDDIYFNDGNVGMGTNIPAVEPGAGKYLTISPSGATTQNQFPSLELQGPSGTGDPTIGRIDFISNSSPGNSAIARIAARKANSAQFNGDIGFYTKSGLPFSASSLQERMTIKFDGKVGIGTTDPISKFHIKTSDAQSARFESTGTKNYLEFFSNNYSLKDFLFADFFKYI